MNIFLYGTYVIYFKYINVCNSIKVEETYFSICEDILHSGSPFNIPTVNKC